jgi:type VI secretion system protein ImpC
MPNIADTRADVHLGVEEARQAERTDSSRPFRILLIGDFSGRSGRQGPPPSFIPHPIDRDNFEEVLERMKVAVDLEGFTLGFRELDDFHPDRLYRDVPLFQSLDRLPEEPERPAARPVAAPGGLLDQIMADNDPEKPVTAEDANDLAAFIRRATAGYTAPRPTAAARQEESRRHALSGELMRFLLHHPGMQAMEAAWRAAFFLVRALDTDGDLKIYLLDATLPELIAQIDEAGKKLARVGRWGLIAGNYTFGQSETEVRALASLAGFARALGAPFLAEGRLPQGENLEENKPWEQLRRSDAAPWLGLAMPRFLLRLPYGKETSPIESFPFEEMTGSEHRSYLWGNPAFFCACLIGQSFVAQGWELARRLARRIDGLPQHIYREDGEPVAKPCAEILMTERAAESLLDLGYMPLASLKNEPAALIVRFQSIAAPAAPLAGLC